MHLMVFHIILCYQANASFLTKENVETEMMNFDIKSKNTSRFLSNIASLGLKHTLNKRMKSLQGVRK